MASAGRYARRAGAGIQGTLSNWINSVIDARLAERQKRKVSERAQDLYTNDAMAHGISESLPVEIVGTGLTPSPQPMTRWLGFDSSWQEEYQQRVYDLTEVWGFDPRNWCDAQRRMNLYMMQYLALFLWRLDGIAVFQVVNKPRPQAPLSLSILPIDSGRLITPSDKQAGIDIYDGIQLDSDGEPVSAWIMKPNRFGTQFRMARSDECTEIPIYDADTGLPNLLLVCDVRNISEYRQDSILTACIKEIRDNNDFVDASLVKALINNLFVLFVQGAYNSNQSNLSWEDRIKEIEKGTLLLGGAEEIPHFLENNTPGSGYDIMNNSILGRLGMATGRGPENIARAYKASYSASQASIENAGKYDDVDRATLVNRFCQPINMLMQYEAVLRGLLPVKSVDHFLRNMHAYTRTDWLPPKLRPIDKQKAASADDMRLKDNTRTYADIYGEQSQDWRVKLRQRAVERAYIKSLEEEYGISMADESPQIEPVQNSPSDEKVDEE